MSMELFWYTGRKKNILAHHIPVATQPKEKRKQLIIQTYIYSTWICFYMGPKYSNIPYRFPSHGGFPIENQT